MKLQYKLGIMALGIVAFTSCEKHDPFDDHVEPGQLVPTCYWEVGSTAVKAGEEFSFTGKYYAEDGNVPKESQVWYSINQADESSATLRLCTGYSYTQTVAATQEIRTAQSMATFAHNLATWDGYEFVIVGKVPTSSTLAPVSWMPKVWDQANFDRYFPAQFADSFMTVVKTNLLEETGSFPAALKSTYVNYDGFTNEYMTEINTEYGVNFPTNVEAGVQGKTKSDFWHFIVDTDGKTKRCSAVKAYRNATGDDMFYVNYDSLKKETNTGSRKKVNKLNPSDNELYLAMNVNPNVVRKYVQVDPSVITNENKTTYYYNTKYVANPETDPNDKETKAIVAIPDTAEVVTDGTVLYYELSEEYYAIYKSSEWLNCRYEPSAASILTAVKPEYVDAVNAMLNSIPFDAWVYNKTETNYSVSFTRKYTLDSSFKVVDEAGNVGVASTKYTLDVN
ncbi:MAG: hypothetical protein UH853_00385 [Muribaculaceae bacterium]|nr:hypothetical protein [Muribaculaceae bacterium]